MDEVWILTFNAVPEDQSSIHGVFTSAKNALEYFEKYAFSGEYPILSKDNLGNITICQRVRLNADFFAIDRHEVK